MIQNWKIGAVLLLLLAALAWAGIWVHDGVALYYVENFWVPGVRGTAMLVPPIAELWAKKLVFYTRIATNEVYTIYPFPNTFINVLFTVRDGLSSFEAYDCINCSDYPLLCNYFYNIGFAPVKSCLECKGKSKIYLVYAIAWLHSLEVKVYNISLAELLNPPLVAEVLYKTPFGSWFCKAPDYIAAEILPNATLKVTFVNAAEMLTFPVEIKGEKKIGLLGCAKPKNYTFTVRLGGDPWFWVGPDYPSAWLVSITRFPYSPRKFLDIMKAKAGYDIIPVSKISSFAVAIFAGNETLRVPPLVYPYYDGVIADPSVEGFAVVSKPPSGFNLNQWPLPKTYCVYNPWPGSPGRDCEAGRPAPPLWDLRNKTAEICYDDGTCARAPAGALLSLPPGYAASGEVVETPLGYAAVGRAYVHKPYYNVSVVLPNGTLVLKAAWNSTFAYNPPDVYLENGTAYLNGTRVAVRVTRDVAITPNYTIYYRVVVETPLGVNGTWARRGSVYRYGGADVVFNNGTRVVVHPAEVLVDKPVVIAPNYTVYYNVSVYTPLGSFWRWAERGAAFRYKGADVDLGNGTRVAVSPVEVSVDKPLVIAPNYTVYYRVAVEMPNGTFTTWVAKGAGFSHGPPFADFGNGTRLAGVRPCVIEAVLQPAACRVEYAKRQYYIRAAFLNGTWEGWADEGAVLRHFYVDSGALGASGAYQLAYEAAVAVDRPGDYAARYRVRGWVSLGDQLMVPIPFAEVRACNATFRTDWRGRAEVEAEATGLCKVEADAPPVSPYTAAAAVAMAGGFVLRRGRKS